METGGFISMRWKTIPVSASAGRIVILTGLPEWSPIPENKIFSFTVFCKGICKLLGKNNIFKHASIIELLQAISRPNLKSA
jgi:hypothetical protein